MTVNEKSLANIKPYEKGNDYGKGRPKGSKNLKTRLIEFLELPVTKTLKDSEGNIIGQDTRSQYDWIVLKHIKKADTGDMRAIELMYDRAEGKVAQTNIHEGNKDAPLETMITIRDEQDQEILDRYYEKRRKLEQKDE